MLKKSTPGEDTYLGIKSCLMEQFYFSGLSYLFIYTNYLSLVEGTFLLNRFGHDQITRIDKMGQKLKLKCI